MTHWLLTRSRASCLLSIGYRRQAVSANSIALKHRGPPRFLGKTKSQLLDTITVYNAYFWVFATAASTGILSYMIYRLAYVVNPEVEKAMQEKQEELRQKEEELLSEGRYQHKA